MASQPPTSNAPNLVELRAQWRRDSKPKHVVTPEREIELIEQYADFIWSLLPSTKPDTPRGGIMTLHSIAMPGRGTAGEVYFAGYDRLTGLADPNRAEITQLSLVEGVSRPGSKIRDKTLLAGGKSSLDLINETHVLEIRYAAGTRLETVTRYSKKEQRSYVLINLNVPGNLPWVPGDESD